MNIKKITQKDSQGNTLSFEFDVPPKQEIPKHPGQPMGTDTVPAWLTPGEFVMNAEATRMFKPQIEAMNNAGQSVQRAQGGTIPEYQARGGKVHYKEEGGIIDWISSLFGNEVPKQDVAKAVSEIPSNIFSGDYNVRPLDLPADSPMAPPSAVPTAAVPNSYLDAMTNAESSGRVDAKNPNSSATGLHQFTAPTWLSVARKYEPEFANSMSEEELLALRTDPATSTRMANHLTNENKRILKNKDIATTNDNLYLLHFGGPSSGVKAITAPAGTKAEDIFTPGQLKANPFLKGMTAEEIRAWSKGKVGGTAQASTSDVPQIFSSAMADEVPQGDYFPSNIPTDVPTAKGTPEIDPNVMVDSNERLTPRSIYTGELQQPHTTVPEPEGVPEKPVNAYAEALKEQRRVAAEQAGQRETIKDAEFIGAREDDIKEVSSNINDVDSQIAELEAMKVVAAEQGLDTTIHDAQIDALEKEKAGLQSDLAVTQADKAQAEEEVRQKSLNLEGTQQYDDAALRDQRKNIADKIVKDTQEQADAEFGAEFDEAIAKDIENRGREAVTGQPDKAKQVMSFFQEWGLADLFDKKEIGRMAALYLGSRAMGYSHGGSLNYALKGYAQRVDAKNTQHAKDVQSMLKEGKYSKESIANYEKSRDIDDLIPAGNTYTPTGDMPEFVLYKGRKMKVQKVKGTDGGYYYQNGAGQIVPMLSSNVSAYEPKLDPNTPEGKAYRHESRANATSYFREQAKLYNTDDDGNYIVGIDPMTAGNHFVEWAKSVGLDPQSDEAMAIMGNAFRTAVEEGKAADYDITDLEPYLNAQFIREVTGSQELFRTNPDEKDKRPTYVNGPDLAKLRSLAEREASLLMPNVARQVGVKKMYETAQAAWGGLSDAEREQWNDKALDDQTGFYKFFVEKLEEHKLGRK